MNVPGVIAAIKYHLICRWFGHTKPLYRPLYRSWYGLGEVCSGQCERCWQVIDERRNVVLKGR
jgi:hypothetical protein